LVDVAIEQGNDPRPPAEAPLEQWRIATHFIFADELPFSYILNAKSGCSTILAHLWALVDRRRGTETFAGDLHRGGPWGRVDQLTADQVTALLGKPIVSMVRNPYARALSGYLSKVGDRRADEDQYVWKIFRARFALGEDEVPSFERYLELIESVPEEERDRHWASQRSNLLQPWAPIDRLFYLEHFTFLNSYFDRFGIGDVARSGWGHRGATELFERYLTPDTAERIARIYATDFETFGYSLDPAIQAPVRPRDCFHGRRDDFLALLREIARPTPHGVIDFVRANQMAGWVRYAGDPAALRIIGRSPGGEVEANVRPADDQTHVFLFEIGLGEAVTPSALRDGTTGAVARIGQDDYPLALWEPVRLASEVGSLDYPQLRRFRHALPTEMIRVLSMQR
jgi:hypothetical protein